jgi:hypothetical protein
VLQLWSQKEGGEKGMVETHGWSQSWPATAFSGIDISAVWMRETDPGPDNPLALNPLGLLPASPDTETLLSGGFTADRGTIEAGVTHIAHNPNPDNDGAYLNIKGVRSWGVNVGSDLFTPVSLGLSFSKSKAKLFDPERLRTQFNRMFELAHVYFERQKAAGAEYDDGERPKGSQVDTWLEFFESPEGIVLASILNKQSVYGIFELNFVYDNGAFELQYGRIWRTYDMSVSVEASAPGLPFLKIGGELSGTMKHCPYETLGLGTLTYIQTVRNGFRNRSVIDLNWWDEWMAYHEDELYALFNHLRWDRHAVGAEVSQALGTVAKPGDDGEAAALRKAAEELLKVVDWATLDAHYKSDDVEERLGRTEKSRRVHLGHLSRRIGRKLKKKTKLTRTINSYGTGMIWLHDDLAWVRGQTFNLENYELTKKAPQRAGEHPMFFLRSGNPYKIVFGLSQPHLIKSAKLELLDNSESVVCEWTLDHKACEFIAYRGEDLKSTAKADIKKIESKFRYDGGKFRSKFGRDYQHTPEMAQAWETDEFGIFVDWIRWDGGKKSTLDSAGKQLKDGQGLSAAGSPYCLRLVAEPLDIVPDLGISPPLAWTYFHVLDDATEKPLEKLVSYLDKKGAYQKFDQDCRWEGTEIAIGDLDVEMRMYQDELDGDQVAIATSDVHQTQSPVVGVNIMPEATDLEEEEELDENDGRDLAPPDDAQPWNQYLGSLLDGPHKKLVNRNVHMVGVLQQDDAWSCSLHSAKNAMWLAQMQSVAQGATRQVAEFQVEFRIEQMADADQFKSRFLGDGSVGAPAPKSWLAVAKQVTPQIVMNGLAGDELAELLQALKDPSRVNPRLLPGVADSIIPVGQMGPGPRYAVKENIKLFVDAVRSFVGDTKAMAFAVGVGNQHFIACLLHQPVDVVEVLVADSLNRSLAQNSLAVEGLLSWVDDLDARIYDSFQVNHGEPLARIQGSDWTVEETAAAIKFLEDCGVMEREEERDRYIDWRNTADLVLAAKDQDPKAEHLRKRLKLDRT